jgi:hypothetical protein
MDVATDKKNERTLQRIEKKPGGNYLDLQRSHGLHPGAAASFMVHPAVLVHAPMDCPRDDHGACRK